MCAHAAGVFVVPFCKWEMELLPALSGICCRAVRGYQHEAHAGPPPLTKTMQALVCAKIQSNHCKDSSCTVILCNVQLLVNTNGQSASERANRDLSVRPRWCQTRCWSECYLSGLQ